MANMESFYVATQSVSDMTVDERAPHPTPAKEQVHAAQPTSSVSRLPESFLDLGSDSDATPPEDADLIRPAFGLTRPTLLDSSSGETIVDSDPATPEIKSEGLAVQSDPKVNETTGAKATHDTDLTEQDGAGTTQTQTPAQAHDPTKTQPPVRSMLDVGGPVSKKETTSTRCAGPSTDQPPKTSQSPIIVPKKQPPVRSMLDIGPPVPPGPRPSDDGQIDELSASRENIISPPAMTKSQDHILEALQEEDEDQEQSRWNPDTNARHFTPAEGGLVELEGSSIGMDVPLYVEEEYDDTYLSDYESDIVQSPTIPALAAFETQFRRRDLDAQSKGSRASRSNSDDVFTLPHNRNSSSNDGWSCASSARSPGMDSSKRPKQHQELENLLLSVSKGGRVCLVSPKAGPLDGKLVAVITTVATPMPVAESISLPADSDLQQYRSHLRTLRATVSEWGPEQSTRPDIWIPLQRMPMSVDGSPDARALRTWTQNLDDSTMNRILVFQSQTSKRMSKQIEAHSETYSWPSPLSSMWDVRDNPATNPPLQTTHNRSLSDADDAAVFPLSAMQQLYFSSSMNRYQLSAATDPSRRFNQSVLLHMSGKYESSEVHAALERLVERHSMLRSRFRKTSGQGGLGQSILPLARDAFNFGEHRNTTEQDVEAIIEKSQACINICEGPIFAADHIRTIDERQLLYLVAHHLVVDVTSWRIIIHDLDSLLQYHTLPPSQSLPFPRWARRQRRETIDGDSALSLPFDVSPPDWAYWGFEPDTRSCYGGTDCSTFSLDIDMTIALQEAAANIFRTESADIFIAAMLLSFRQTFPDRQVPTVWKQEDAREASIAESDVANTVGWFTTLCPVTAAVDSASDFVELLKLVKDTRKAISRQGIPYFNAQVASQQRTPHAAAPIELMFNCVDTLPNLHRKDGVLLPVPGPSADFHSLSSDVGEGVGRIALFETSVVIDESGARVILFYSKGQRQQSRIEAWAHGFEHILKQGVEKLQELEPQLTLADTPLLKTSYEGLSKLTSDRLASLGINSASEVETIFPVNPTQQDILLSQAAETSTFHVSCVYEFTTEDGAADTGRLCTAWEQLVNANASLRSIFIDSIGEDGLFDQLVLKRISPNMLFIDGTPEALTTLPAMKAALGQPQHRLSVCKTMTSTFVCFDANQAICDATSMDNLISQLRVAYDGQTPSINSSVLSTYLYRVSSTGTSRPLDSLTADLATYKPCNLPNLSVDRKQTTRSKSFDLEVSVKQLHDFCKRQESTPAAVLQLAWALVLRVFVGVDQVCFGYEVQGRDEKVVPGLGEAVGSYATVLPWYLDLSPDRALRHCLQDLRSLVSRSRERQHLTASEIQHALGLKDETLFNTCLSFYDSARSLSSAGNSTEASLNAKLVSCFSNTSHDLSIHASIVSEKLHLDVCSRTFSPVQANNTISAFDHALRVILDSDTRSRIADIDLFSDRDYAYVAVQNWEASHNEEKTAAKLHQVILQQAKSRPDALAVSARDGDLTYLQLANFTASLAAYLVNLGVRPGVLVPCVLEKCRWSPVIMLAILKAGGCAVCLDAQEKTNVDATIEELNPNIIVATETAWKGYNGYSARITVVGNTFFSSLPPQVSIPAREARPDDAACLLFSPGKGRSGSPKSIFFTHASLCSTFFAQGPALKINKNSRVLQLSAFNVDIALVEIFGTMVQGGCVCIPSARERGSGLDKAINRMNVTWTYMTAVLARRVDPAMVPSLQTVCFRTRTIDDDVVDTWIGKRQVLLAYGAPDVCPLGISIAEVTSSHQPTIIPPPLMGKFWVLNPENPKRLMPVGAIGELAIDSQVITPHKFNPGEPLTAPSSPPETCDGPRAQSLRTGHRVRYLDNGSIQFLSSMRDEVLLAGAAVPVSDIENHLRHGLGRGYDIAVDSITTSDSVQVLVAFLELRDQQSDSLEDFGQMHLTPDVKNKLVQRLVKATGDCRRGSKPKIEAQHMPSIFIPLKRFPLTTSLKINKRKLQKLVAFLTYSQLAAMSPLPNPEELRHAPASEEKPLPLTPLTRTEQTMRKIWAGVLGVAPVDITGNDSFTGLGGDRHLISELIVACRNASMTISLRDLLKGANLSDICKTIAPLDAPANESRVSRQVYGSASTPLTTTPAKVLGFPEVFIKEAIAPQLRVPRREIVDMTETTSQQLRSLEMDLYKEKSSIRCLILNFNGPVRHQRLELACESLSRLHPTLRTVFAIHENHAYQVLLESFKPEFVRQSCPSSRLTATADDIVRKEQKNYTLALNEPATRFTFLDGGEQSCLIIRLSAGQVDEPSVPLLVQDLTSLYKNANTAQSKATLFDYVRTTKIANYHDGIDFWKAALDGSEPTEVVAHERPCPPVSDVQTLHQSIRLGYIGDYGIAFNTILKTAWAYTLSSLAGSNDVVFGEVIQGRGNDLPSDIATLVGPTTNVIPVRVRFPRSKATALSIMQDTQGQRAASRPFESVNTLDVIRRCTKWDNWRRFSTVVHNRSQTGGSGISGTLNMGNVTFTYRFVEPEAVDLPDIQILATLESPEKAYLELKYSSGRVPTDLAEQAMTLLVSCLRRLTRQDIITQPMLQPMVENAPEKARIPIGSTAVSPTTASLTSSAESSAWQYLTDEQRVAVQKAISVAWDDIIKPEAEGITENQAYTTNFYDVWGSLLPAYFFAEYMNRQLANGLAGIAGVEKLRISPEDIIQHPTMTTQFELLVARMREAGLISMPIRKRTSFSLGSQGGSFSAWPNPMNKPSNLSLSKSLRRFPSSGASSVRDLSTKAGGWMKHRINRSRGSINGGVKPMAPVEKVEEEPEREDAARASLVNPTPAGTEYISRNQSNAARGNIRTGRLSQPPQPRERTHLRTGSEPIADFAELPAGSDGVPCQNEVSPLSPTPMHRTLPFPLGMRGEPSPVDAHNNPMI